MTRSGNAGNRRLGSRPSAALAALVVGWLVSLAEPAAAVVSYGDWLRINGMLENYTAINTETFTGAFLSIERNTVQLETEAVLLRKLGFIRQLKFDAMIRPWYDPVYHVNTKRYGIAAHDKVLGTLDSIVGPVDFVVPVNPNSSRGSEPVFNDKDRFEQELFYQEYREILRQAYFDITTTPFFRRSSFGDTLFIRIGKQQVAWGKTDFFRLADIINPIDYKRHAFLEFYDQIRMPQWILHMVYNFGSLGPFSDVSVETDWNFDRPLGSYLGPGGAPYSHPFADEIRGFKVFYQEGIPNGTFAGLPFPVPPGVLGLRNSSTPDYTLGNTQYGGRIQGVWEGVTWSVDYWHGYNDLPTFRLVPSLDNPLLNDDVTTLLLNPDGTNRKGAKIPLYDMRYYMRETVGGSFDWPEEWTQSVWRAELTYSFQEHVNDTSDLDTAIQKTDVLRYVIGWDRPTFIKPLNPTRTFLLSAQSFLTHVLDHHGPARGPGTIQDPLQVIFTFLVLGFYDNDRLLPVFFAGYQMYADAILVGGWVQYLFTDNIDATLGANSISGRARVFDFGAGGGDPNATPPTGIVQSQSRIPWGPAKEGFGAWRKIDDFYLRIRYRF